MLNPISGPQGSYFAHSIILGLRFRFWLFVPQPEGWGYFFGSSGSRAQARRSDFSGDGHTGIKIDRMKASEDDRFEFRFTFINTGREKGFVTHYRPKHLPVSSEVDGVLHFLGLKQFSDCPEFDFEQCYFRTRAFEEPEGRIWNSSVEHAHAAFDAHATQFSTACAFVYLLVHQSHFPMTFTLLLSTVCLVLMVAYHVAMYLLDPDSA